MFFSSYVYVAEGKYAAEERNKEMNLTTSDKQQT
jgi:hypothetical protein